MAIASRFWTYAEILAKVERDLDLEGEVFVQPAEMLGYCNEAIDNAEKIVKNTYADYFLDKDTLTLVEGANEVAMPSRLYAHKIRRIIYRSGSQRYTMNRVKDWKKFEVYDEEFSANSSSSELRYFILNQSAGSPKILLTRNASGADAAATVT
jgi:hypothetical protein